MPDAAAVAAVGRCLTLVAIWAQCRKTSNVKLRIEPRRSRTRKRKTGKIEKDFKKHVAVRPVRTKISL